MFNITYFIVSQTYKLGQFNTIIWDNKKFKIGDSILVFNGVTNARSLVQQNTLWYCKIIAFVAHMLKGQCLQILMKVQWYDIHQQPKYPNLTTYKITNTTDIISPTSIRSICTAITANITDKSI